MLLAVVILFLLTELPQGIVNLLSGVLDQFVDEVYNYTTAYLFYHDTMTAFVDADYQRQATAF
jgi:hypothetical protein